MQCGEDNEQLVTQGATPKCSVWHRKEGYDPGYDVNGNAKRFCGKCRHEIFDPVVCVHCKMIPHPHMDAIRFSRGGKFPDGKDASFAAEVDIIIQTSKSGRHGKQVAEEQCPSRHLFLQQKTRFQNRGAAVGICRVFHGSPWGLRCGPWQV